MTLGEPIIELDSFCMFFCLHSLFIGVLIYFRMIVYFNMIGRYHIESTELENLGWKQKIDFPTGLSLTKDWYIAHPNHWGDISSALQAHPSFTSR
jgi:hypothetical protein